MEDKIEINTYAELDKFVKMFADDYVELLILESLGGYGKTFSIKTAMKGKDYLMLSSHITPMALYTELYKHQDKPIILEDIDALLKSQVSVSLLKQLTETTRDKTLQYYTTTASLKVPMSFQTTSNVLISCNKLSAKDRNVNALVSRGLWLNFCPSINEIFKKMEIIVNKIDIVTLDKKKRHIVLKFLKDNSVFAKSFNLRHLSRGLQMFDFHLSDKTFKWKKHLIDLLHADTKLVEMQELQNSKLTEQQRMDKFSGSRATYYRYLQRYKEVIK